MHCLRFFLSDFTEWGGKLSSPVLQQDKKSSAYRVNLGLRSRPNNLLCSLAISLTFVDPKVHTLREDQPLRIVSLVTTQTALYSVSKET